MLEIKNGDTYHSVKPSGGDNESGMNQSIKVNCVLLQVALHITFIFTTYRQQNKWFK
jgi:hypothetical protein